MTNELRNEYIDKLRKVALLQAGVPFNEVETFVKYVTGDEPQSVASQAQEIAGDIGKKTYVDTKVDARYSFKPFN